MITIIISVTTITYLFMLIYLRGIMHESPNEMSDATKLLKVANKYKFSEWISSIHDHDHKVSMKDFWILILALVKKFMKRKLIFYDIVILSLIFHLLTSVLIYLSLKNLFSQEVAFLFSIANIFSFWPYIIISNGGHHTAPVFLFWLIIYLFEQIFLISTEINFTLLFISGFIFSILNFSSPSSNKLNLSVFVALLYFFSNTIVRQYFELESFFNLNNNFLFIILHILFIFLCLFYNLKKFDYIEKVFQNNNKNNFKNLSLKYTIILKKTFIYGNLFFLLNYIICYNLDRDITQFVLILFYSGFFLGLLFFLLPNIEKSFFKYYLKLTSATWGSHFLGYENKNIIKKTNKLKWHINFFLYFLTDFIIFYLVIFFIYLSITDNVNISLLLFIFFYISLPIFYNVLTNGVLAGFPLFPFFSIFLCSAAFYVNEIIIFNNETLNYFIYFIFLIYIIKNIFVIFYDILPSRLIHKNIINYLKTNRIKCVYVFSDIRNSNTIDVIEENNNIRFKKINKFSQIPKKSILLLCSLNDKGYHFQSGAVGKGKLKFIDQDFSKKFNDDPHRFEIIKSFENCDSSKYWQCMGEVVSKRFLLLKEITNKDFFLGKVHLIKI